MQNMFVFSGAGIRFPIFLGLYSAVAEKYSNLRADYLIGTSGGALAALILKLSHYIANGNSKEIDTVTHTLLQLDFKNIVEKSNVIPLVGLWKYYGKYKWNVKKIHELLEQWFDVYGQHKLFNMIVNDEHSIKIPAPQFLAIATNISEFKWEVLSSNNRLRDDLTIMTASSAAPYYFTPVKYKNSWYVDGGLTKQLGIDIALELGLNKEECSTKDNSNTETTILNIFAINLSQKFSLTEALNAKDVLDNLDNCISREAILYLKNKYCRPVDRTPDKIESWSEYIERIVNSILNANVLESIDDIGHLKLSKDYSLVRTYNESYLNACGVSYIFEHSKTNKIIRVCVINIGVADIPSFAIEEFENDPDFRFALYLLGNSIGRNLSNLLTLNGV